MSWSFGLDLGSALGGLIGAGASMISSKRQMHYQSALQREAAALNYDYGIKSLENSPTAQRKGLVSAGYNPMLAVSNATSGANSGWTSTGQASNFDASQGIASGISGALQIQGMKNQTKQVESQIGLNEANARNATAEAINQELRNPYVTRQEQAQLGRIGAETDKLIRETSYYDQLAENMEAQRRLQEMGINLDYRARIYGADKGYAGNVYNADTLYNIANEHQPTGSSSSFKNYAGGVRDIMSGVGDIIHGRNDTYENYDESVQHSSRDKKTGVTTTTKSRKTGRRKK